MLEGVNKHYSDANDLQNVYGRIAGTPAINNVPMINNIISGYIFDFSAHPYQNFQIYFHLNETYKIFIRTRNDQGFSNWEQIYPDYSDIKLTQNGYIVLNNGLIIQWAELSNRDTLTEIRNGDGILQYEYTHTLPITFMPINLITSIMSTDYYPFFIGIVYELNSQNLKYHTYKLSNGYSGEIKNNAYTNEHQKFNSSCLGKIT